MGKLKKYNQFINESKTESIKLKLDRNGKPRFKYDFDGEHGDVDYSKIENLKPTVIDDFIEEMVRCVEVNHEILADDLSKRVDEKIKETFVENIKWYFEPIDINKDSSRFSFRYDDISLAFAKLINLGYSIGYLTEKYSVSGWNFSDFFGWDGEVFTRKEDFKKISSEPLNYSGPDVTHSSILAGSLSIKQSLSDDNIRYGEEEQGKSEISVIFSRPFLLGFDAGAKMVDAEQDLYFSKIGTNKGRYYDLLLNNERTPEEEEEYKEIRRKKDIIRYGEDYVKNLEKSRSEFDALPKEEQERRRKENADKLSKMMDDLFKDL